MIYLLLFSFLLTFVFIFWSVFKKIFFFENKLENRIQHYLSVTEDKEKESRPKVEVKHFTLIQLMKQRIQKKVLTKEKNNKLETKLAQAGLPIKPEEYILFQWILIAFLGGLFFLFTGNWFFVLVGGILGFILPRMYVSKKQRVRVSKFNEGLADMITTIVGSLRAGFSFSQALKSVVEEANSPIKDEMESVIKEMQYGKSIERLKGTNAK